MPPTPVLAAVDAAQLDRVLVVVDAVLRQAFTAHVPLRGPDLAGVLDPVPDDDVQRPST